MSFQKILDINRNDNINHCKSLENKNDMKKLTKKMQLTNVVNILEKGNTNGGRNR